MGEKRVIALGFFDGVHVGHKALMDCCCTAAARENAVSCALTFETHPDKLVLAEATKTLYTNEQRVMMLKQIGGVQEVLVLPFDETIMHQSWQDFVVHTLVGQFHACHLVAGHNFRFGYRGQGTAQKLENLCKQLGIGCDIVEDVKVAGEVVSTTRIKFLLEQGQVEKANRLLGHAYEMAGEIQKGQGIGGKTLFPTVNIVPPDYLFTPPFGVYATVVQLHHRRYTGVTNVGIRPTMQDGRGITVETYLFDFDQQAYGEYARVFLLKFLRPETRYANQQLLKAAIANDIETAKRYFGTMHAGDREQLVCTGTIKAK